MAQQAKKVRGPTIKTIVAIDTNIFLLSNDVNDVVWICRLD